MSDPDAAAMSLTSSYWTLLVSWNCECAQGPPRETRQSSASVRRRPCGAEQGRGKGGVGRTSSIRTDSILATTRGCLWKSWYLHGCRIGARVSRQSQRRAGGRGSPAQEEVVKVERVGVLKFRLVRPALTHGGIRPRQLPPAAQNPRGQDHPRAEGRTHSNILAIHSTLSGSGWLALSAR